MAKALLGYVGGSDVRVQDQARRLKRRVSELEDLVLQLKAENAALAADDTDQEFLTAPEPAPEYHPALT